MLKCVSDPKSGKVETVGNLILTCRICLRLLLKYTLISSGFCLRTGFHMCALLWELWQCSTAVESNSMFSSLM